MGATNSSGYSVVIADDDDGVRAALTSLLDGHPRLTVVGAAADGVGAAEMCRRRRPRLAIVDVKMPAGDVAAVTSIRSVSPSTLIVAYTAYGDRRTRERLLAAGTSAVFVKGGGADLPAELLELIEHSPARLGDAADVMKGDGRTMNTTITTPSPIELPTRVVVALDQDLRGLRAARWAMTVARQLGVELVVVTTVDNASTEHSPTDEIGFEMETSMALRDWLSHNGVDVDRFIVIERSPDGLFDNARPDDLVVIGVDAHEGLTSWALGSRPHELAHRLPCPLVLIPPADTHDTGDTGETGTTAAAGEGPLVVGLDGTDGNRAVVDWAKAFGDALHRPVSAAYARDPMYDTFDNAGNLGPAERSARTEAQIEDMKLIERPGDASVVLGDIARELSAFVVVVGARQKHSLGGMLLGDVVDHLIHTPPGPVAIVTHDFLDRVRA